MTTHNIAKMTTESRKQMRVTGCTKSQLWKAAKAYVAKGLIPVPIGIHLYEWREDKQEWKKIIDFPNDWHTTTNDNALERFSQPTRFVPNGLVLRCNADSGIFALDIDNNQRFADCLQENGHKFPETVTQKSGSGKGTHYIFKHEERLTEKFNGTEQNILLYGVSIDADLRGAGKACLIAHPSRFVSETDPSKVWEYAWHPNKSMLNMDPQPMPDWLFDAISPAPKKPSRLSKRQKTISATDEQPDERVEVRDISEDMSAEILRLCTTAFPEIDAEDLGQPKWKKAIVVDVTARRCLLRQKKHTPAHGYLFFRPDAIVYRCHSGAYEECNSEIKRPYLITPLICQFLGVSPLHAWLNVQDDISDLGLATYIAETHLKDTVLATRPSDGTPVWEYFVEAEGIWKRARATVILLPALRAIIAEVDALIDAMFQELLEVQADPKRDSKTLSPQELQLESRVKMARKLKKHCSNDAPQRAVRNCMDPIMLSRGCGVEWDAKPFLVHCSNGVYDMKAHTFRKARPDDYGTKSTHLEYKPVAEHLPERLAVIEQYWHGVTLGDLELRNFLYSLLVVSLMSTNADQFFAFIIGSGSNGKSFLQHLIRKVTGDYGVPLSPKLLTNPPADPSKSDPATMAMKGARAGISADMAEESANAATLMNIGGGDEVSARGHYEDQQSFRLVLFLWIMTNAPPDVSQKTDGYARKVCCIPFKAKFVDHVPTAPHEIRKDYTLEDRLLPCADVMLAIVLEHARFYWEHRLKKPDWPKSVREATEHYLTDQNPGQCFIQQCITAPKSKNDILKVSEGKHFFKHWCDQQGVRIAFTKQVCEQFLSCMDATFGANSGRVVKDAENKAHKGWACVIDHHNRG